MLLGLFKNDSLIHRYNEQGLSSSDLSTDAIRKLYQASVFGKLLALISASFHL